MGQILSYTAAIIVGTGGGALALAGGGVIATASISEGALVAATVLGATGVTAIATTVYSKETKRTGKEKADDKPSWINRSMVDYQLTPQQNAIKLLNDKYGVGNWTKGSAKEFNKIVKWIQRTVFAAK